MQRAPMNDSDRLLEATKNLVEGATDPRDEALVEEAHPADLASVLKQLPLVDQVTIFRTLSPERAAEVLPELDDHALLELVRALDEVEVSRILDEMPAEHAADVVEELPTEQAEKILDLMERSEEHTSELQSLRHLVCRLLLEKKKAA